jgi:hypothetical protein
MSKYTSETYEMIWLVENWDGKDYRIVKNSENEYRVFFADDLEEVSHTNFAVKKDYTRFDGRFMHNNYYFEVLDNFLHSTTDFAICCPCGLEVYQPHTETTYYLIKGKILSYKEWIEVVQGHDSFPEAMAHILAAQHSVGLANN